MATKLIKGESTLSNKIQTERLQLRRPIKNDFAVLANLWKNTTIRLYLGGIITDNEIDQKTLAIEEHWFQHGFGLFTVCERSTQKLIGLCGLHSSHDHDKKIEASYIFFPEFWGKGLATEALLATIHYGFEQLNISEIISITQEANTASCRLLEKVGMNCVDQFKKFGKNQRMYMLMKEIAYAK